MNIFITGITGTLGTSLVKLLASRGDRIFGISRQEKKIKDLEDIVPATIYLGDINNKKLLNNALSRAGKIDLLFHLAALKHVDLGEEFIENFIGTNISGTYNVLNAQKKFNIPKVIFSATDKGVMPVNVYGCTKHIAEKLVLANHNNVVCRYGNVVGSNGSLIQTLKQRLKDGETKFFLTHTEMTRYFIKIEDAAKFVLDSSEKIGVQIPEMKALKIEDIMKVMVKHYCPQGSYDIIGARPGEKIHEDITLTRSSKDAERFSEKEIIELLKD